MRRQSRFFIVILTICSIALCSSCSSSRYAGQSLSALADRIWLFSQDHPDGFTLDISTMTEPMKGISVGYEETQHSHSRKQLRRVVRHALKHDGYVGGWFNSDDSLYYFDSTRLFPEDSLIPALRFAKQNGQYAVFILSKGETISVE
ncbi:MAG: hypothetical protein Q4D30_05180 [Bacteroidales bacterium]|nr:hypothetical protein [Bacteroidales bacterium]